MHTTNKLMFSLFTPSPIDSVPEQCDLKLWVVDEIVPSEWFALGMILNIPHQKLAAMEENHARVDRRCTEMLNFWISSKTKLPTTWSTLIDALRKAKENRVAETIMKKLAD